MGKTALTLVSTGLFLTPLTQAYGALLTLSGARTGDGPLMVAIYQDEDTWLKPQKAVITKKIPVDQDTIQVAFDLKPGVYAIHTFQDKNENGKLDMQWLPPGPAEPWVVSNGAQGTMGPPSFSDAKITVTSDSAISLKLQKP